MTYFNNSGHLSEEGVTYVSATLNGSSAAHQHMQSCHLCKTEVDILNDFLEEEGFLNSPSNVFQMRSMVYKSASVAAILLAGFMLWPTNSSPTYTEISMYESMIHEPTRGTFLTIQSPEIGARITSSTIEFRWETDETLPITIVIINEKDEIIDEIITDNNNVTYQHTLRSGLYYWKLETEDDLLKIGKFIIVK